jgi:hypothetical protein
MGPFPPADLDQKGLPAHVPALKWIDEPKDLDKDLDKKKIKTNKSEEDLELKDLDNLNKVTVHRDKPKSCLKNTIKPFKIDVNQLTGIKNFTQISSHPLAIPADREFQFSGPLSHYHAAYQKEKESAKAITNGENFFKPRKEGSAKKEIMSKKDGSNRKEESVKISSRDQIASPTNDLFYNKQQQSETQGAQN